MNDFNELSPVMFAAGIPTIARRISLAACLAHVVACADDPVTVRSAASIELVAGDGQSGTTGISLSERIAVRALDQHHQPVPNVAVEWTVLQGGGSITPLVSRTDADGIAHSTWTMGLAPGPQEAKVSAASARPLRVRASATGMPDTCGGTPLDIPVGGALELVGLQLPDICIAPGTSSAREFVLVVFNRTRAAVSDATIAVQGTNIVSATQPPLPSPDPVRMLAGTATRRWRDDAFDARLREIERYELGPRVARGGDATFALAPLSPSPRLAQLSNPVPGDIVTLNANGGNACSINLERPARIAAVSQRAIVVDDLRNPDEGFTTADFESIAATFDTLVYPLDVANFGVPTDIDGNGRVVLFFTAEVNRLTPSGAGSGSVAGFFFARDLFPRAGSSRLSACPTSNEAEMLYMMVPDPEGTINGNERDKEFVRQRTVSTLAHELQHLINASRRLRVTPGAIYPERGWLDEALAHSAEELLFLRAAGLSPRQNITGPVIQATEERRIAFTEHQSENITRLQFFLNAPNSGWLHEPGSPDVPTRGAGAYFLRYLVDRLERPEEDTWRALTNNPDTGLRNLEGVIGADAGDWMRDWAAALYVDDAVGDLNLKHQVASWHMRSVLLSLDDDEPYPIPTIRLFNGVARQQEMKPGGAVYFRFGLSPTTAGTLRLTAEGSDAAELSLVLVRTR